MPRGLSGSLSSSRRAYYNRPSCKPPPASLASTSRKIWEFPDTVFAILPGRPWLTGRNAFIINACLFPPRFYSIPRLPAPRCLRSLKFLGHAESRRDARSRVSRVVRVVVNPLPYRFTRKNPGPNNRKRSPNETERRNEI